MYEVNLSYEKSPQTLMFTGGASILTASHAGGHWFESSSLHHEKTLESQWFRGFFFAFFWKKRASLLAVFWGIFGQFRGFLLQKCCKFFGPLSVVPQGFAVF